MTIHPSKSDLKTALQYMLLEAARLENEASEAAKIYKDATKCIAFTLACMEGVDEM